MYLFGLSGPVSSGFFIYLMSWRPPADLECEILSGVCVREIIISNVAFVWRST